MPLLLAAPDKFRGTATAAEAAEAIARGARAAGWDAVAVPVADGGEGLLDVLGGANRTTVVTGPLGDEVDAVWRLDGRTAVIEMARASGLVLAGGPDGNDPLQATTTGTGELIVAAVEAGARRVIVGMGGSATTDGGLGAVRAIADRLHGVELVVACDVTTTFVDAARIFASQKGASAAQVELLGRRLDRLAQVYQEDFGVDVRWQRGSGAAGGLAGGLAAVGGRLESGFDVVADLVDLDDRVEEADYVITGEGYLDEQSFAGKTVGGVVTLAHAWGREAGIVAGDTDTELDDFVPMGVEVVSLVESYGDDRARRDTIACIEAAAHRLVEGVRIT